ncbi:MAG: HupE/UreJ family protein [Ilumatobacteraceae bacterium]
MIAAVVQDLGGWWSGVLHPFDGPHLVLMLVVALLAGVATTQGRESWVGPSAWIVGTMLGIAGAAAGVRLPFVDGALMAALLVAVALMFAPPPKVSQVLPLAALLGGAMHGLSYLDGSRDDHTVVYAIGFVFTTVLLQTFGAIVGTAVGRSPAMRRLLGVAAAAGALVVAATG